jgi:hypothetical protein
MEKIVTQVHTRVVVLLSWSTISPSDRVSTVRSPKGFQAISGPHEILNPALPLPAVRRHSAQQPNLPLANRLPCISPGFHPSSLSSYEAMIVLELKASTIPR